MLKPSTAGALSMRSAASNGKNSRALLLRRGLSEVEAAIYLSLSPSFFRRLVDQGVMPRPRIAGARRVWDVEELDLAFKALPREGGEVGTFGAAGGDSWADFQ
jgi:hypothetical protein